MFEGNGPAFASYDRIHYRQLISHHLADLKKIPRSILKYFKAGAFAVSLTGSKAIQLHLMKRTKCALIGT